MSIYGHQSSGALTGTDGYRGTAATFRDGRPDFTADVALKTLADGAPVSSGRAVELHVSQGTPGSVIDVDTAVLDDLSFTATQEELEKTWSGVLQGFDNGAGVESGGSASPLGAAGEILVGDAAAEFGALDVGSTPSGLQGAGGAEVQDYLTQTVSIQHTQFHQAH